MGRPLGAFDTDELDRPDLNKCPDCGCFFATDACTICGKICPEEMRAGHRAKVKQKKHKSGGYSGRVQFIPWYHTWIAMLLIGFFMPYVAIVLFITSPYSKKLKIIVSAVLVAWFAISYTGILPRVIEAISYDSPVNDKLSRTEYTERCTGMTAEEFYRLNHEDGAFITMELLVEGRLEGVDGEVYYLCTGRGTGGVSVILQDCNLEKPVNYMVGDLIEVWGESAGMKEVEYNSDDAYNFKVLKKPCLYMAYCELIG